MLKPTKKQGIRKAFNGNIRYKANDQPTSRSKTGVKGVYRTGGGGKYRDYYQARITVDGKEKLLYSGKSMVDAIIARKAAEEKYYAPLIKEAIEKGYLEEVS